MFEDVKIIWILFNPTGMEVNPISHFRVEQNFQKIHMWLSKICENFP